MAGVADELQKLVGSANVSTALGGGIVALLVALGLLRGYVGMLINFVWSLVFWIFLFSFLLLLIVGNAVAAAKTKGGPKVQAALEDSVAYYQALWYFQKGGKLSECPFFKNSRQTRLQVFSLVLTLRLWDKPHYRNGTYQHDMLKNLRNVAIPGTGVPLSLVVQLKVFAYVFLILAYPSIAVVAALIRCGFDPEKAAVAYSEQLLTPQDWFSFWQLNCRLATYHSSVTKETDYKMEDKWEFLMKAEELGIPVTPCMKVPAIVCKHRNEEGGLGFASFRNATEGGDWIIQEKLGNGPFLSTMLPSNAPLSTFRIISASRGGLKSGTSKRGEVSKSDIMALSCVWRAGHAGAETDHSCILFNIDPKTGIMKKGTTNNHWYKRGFGAILTTPHQSFHDKSVHPDSGKKVEGVKVPNMQAMRDFVVDAHLKMMPHVPLAGWDVAMVDSDRMILLESNLSCNFFRGDFDQEAYFKFVEDYFLDLEKRE